MSAPLNWRAGFSPRGASAPQALAAVVLALLATVPGAAAPPASPKFVKTQDSDTWVRQTFRLQSRYTRVLLVGDPDAKTDHVMAAVPDLNATGAAKPGKRYAIAQRFATLQEAADAARGGDLVAVLPGHYAGFVLGDKPDARDGSYIHFKALGPPQEVVIDAPSKDAHWSVLLDAAHHVILEGFNVAGTSGPGLEAKGTTAGFMFDGFFRRTSKQVHHAVLMGVFSHNHKTWGFHSRDTHTVLIQDSVFALSCQEHSAYVSDGSDNYVIRRNIFFGSYAGGLQINLDPESSLAELLVHPAFKQYPRPGTTRAWALGLVDLARRQYGEDNFPDGRGVNFIVENNVMNANGKHGGGSLNLAGLQDSLIQNNLIYSNFNHGIALWDNGNPYDAASVMPGPASAADVKGPESLPFWGCYRNVIRNNTVLMANPGRFALLLSNGSWGNLVRNNVLINDVPSSVEVTSTSIYKLDSGYNVLNAIQYSGMSAHSRRYVVQPGTSSASPFEGSGMDASLKKLAVHLDEANHSVTGITREKSAREFVRYGEEPWVIIEGGRWRLNPGRPDFHVSASSGMLRGTADRKNSPPRNVAGERRYGGTIGAY
jgi:hypothetical protein